MIHNKASCLALFTHKHPLTHYSKLELGDFSFSFSFCIHKRVVREGNQTKQTLKLSMREGGSKGRRGSAGEGEGVNVVRRTVGHSVSEARQA